MCITTFNFSKIIVYLCHLNLLCALRLLIHTDMLCRYMLCRYTYVLLINLLIFNVLYIVTITTQPMNVTVCLSQSTTANFTCVVDEGGTGIASTGWQILVGANYISVVGRPRHMFDPRFIVTNAGTIITETLTITDVSLSDNGAKYRCQPLRDVISDVVTLTVIGMYWIVVGICMYVCKKFISLLVYM